MHRPSVGGDVERRFRHAGELAAVRKGDLPHAPRLGAADDRRRVQELDEAAPPGATWRRSAAQRGDEVVLLRVADGVEEAGDGVERASVDVERVMSPCTRRDAESARPRRRRLVQVDGGPRRDRPRSANARRGGPSRRRRRAAAALPRRRLDQWSRSAPRRRKACPRRSCRTGGRASPCTSSRAARALDAAPTPSTSSSLSEGTRGGRGRAPTAPRRPGTARRGTRPARAGTAAGSSGRRTSATRSSAITARRQLVAREAELVLDHDRVHPVDVARPRLLDRRRMPATSASAFVIRGGERRFSRIRRSCELRRGPSRPGSRSCGSCSRAPRGGSAAGEREVAQQPQPRRRAVVVGRHHAALAGGDDLVRVEAEAAHAPNAPVMRPRHVAPWDSAQSSITARSCALGDLASAGPCRPDGRTGARG